MAWNLKQKAQDHTVSIVSALIALLSLAVWQAVPSSAWDRVSEVTPKRALWALLGLAVVAVCLLIAYLIQLKLKLRNQLKPLFGIFWDRHGNPFCPACSVLMQLDGPSGCLLDKANCPKCKTSFTIVDPESVGYRVTFDDLRKGLRR